MSQVSYEDWKRILARERLPAAVVDLDAFDRNAEKLAQLALGKRIRIATKSLRVPELILRVLRRGAPFHGVMCYSAEEAALLSREGVNDILIAYPTLQTSDLKALRETHEAGAEVTLIVDSPEGVSRLADVLRGSTEPFRVAIDMDASERWLSGSVHVGVRRSPVRTLEHLSNLMDRIANYPELKLVGVMMYEAQVAGLGDKNPFKKFLNPVAHWIRMTSAKSVAAKRRAVEVHFHEKRIPLELFNGGGTGSLNFAAEEKALTELTAGSALYCPHLFDYFSNVQFEPSCFFALQAVRSSDENFVTCQGGGYIASGEAGRDRLPVPYLPKGATLVGTEGAGEVQTPVRVSAATEAISLGGPVLFRHAKAGELMERFNEVLLIAGGRIVDRAKTYRGLGASFF